MLLFEVLQPPESMNELPKDRTHGAMRPLAWAFLKIQSEHGPMLGELKLQLYSYQTNNGTPCLRSPQPQLGARVNNSAKEVRRRHGCRSATAPKIFYIFDLFSLPFVDYFILGPLIDLRPVVEGANVSSAAQVPFLSPGEGGHH
jgi:hypothetical protein